MKKYSAAITIRTFNLSQNELSDFLKICEISYINTSGKRLSEKNMCDILKDVDVVIAGTEPLTKKVLNNASQLKIISRVGVGLDNIDLETAHNLNIVVLSTPYAPVNAVAEHTLTLILCILKNIIRYNDSVKKRTINVIPGKLLSGKSIGVVGIGKIGKKTGKILDYLGCRILYYDPWVNDSPDEKWIRKSSISELLADVDVVTLHTPAQKNNRPILDSAELTQCKKGLVIINTSRGSLVDEDALINALDSGNVSAAGLDVQSVEPYTGPLLHYQQVILTPHVASNTIESRHQMEMEAVENVIRTIEEIE